MDDETLVPRYLHAPHAELTLSGPNGWPASKRSDLHALILGLVWLTVATGAIVFTEPAPFDALMLGLVVLLPIAGLSTFTPGLLLMLAAWLVVAACGFGAAVLSLDMEKSVTHTAVTLYLSVAGFVLAGFILKKPEAHMRLIMNAYMWSAAVSALLGVIGYFDLFPGAYDLFTGFGRARGAFKDPNVFAPYLVPPLVHAIQLWLSRPVTKAFVPLGIVFLLSFALFLSFSRGAWVNLAVALGVFGYLSFVLSATNWARFKLAMIALACVAAFAVVTLAALQFDSISKLAAERATLDQSYDQGPEGRFGGQLKAVRLILENPFGIGAGEFTQRHHTEEVHNVYLSMMLNAGWTGGILYAMTIIITLLFGLRQLVRRTSFQSELIVAWSCLFAVAFEGFVIDSDHWRHFFLLMAMVWGLGEAARVPVAVMAGGLPRRLRRVLATRPRLVDLMPPLAARPRRKRIALASAVVTQPCASSDPRRGARADGPRAPSLRLN